MAIFNHFGKKFFAGLSARPQSVKVSKGLTTEKIKPFEKIPGPLSLPIIGTLYLYFPFIGILFYVLILLLSFFLKKKYSFDITTYNSI